VFDAAARRLLDQPLTGVLTSIGPSGAPHGSPVWFDITTSDAEHPVVLVSITTNRQKHANLVARPQCALTVIDPENSMRYVEVRGTATITPDPDKAFMYRIGERYGLDVSPYDKPTEERVVVTITPRKVLGR
jgi:PPOX class probable F420-dependent enzyme